MQKKHIYLISLFLIFIALVSIQHLSQQQQYSSALASMQTAVDIDTMSKIQSASHNLDIINYADYSIKSIIFPVWGSYISMLHDNYYTTMSEIHNYYPELHYDSNVELINTASFDGHTNIIKIPRPGSFNA